MIQRVRKRVEEFLTGFTFKKTFSPITNSIHDAPASLHSFTLTELLVILTIIGILTAIVVPAISSVAKNQDSTAICMENLRKQGKAILMYVNDYDGYFPTMGEPGSGEDRWITWNYGGHSGNIPKSSIPANLRPLYKYLKPSPEFSDTMCSGSPFWCLEDTVGHNPWWGSQTVFYFKGTSYHYNNQGGINWRTGRLNAVGGLGGRDISQIEDPSKKLMVAEICYYWTKDSYYLEGEPGWHYEPGRSNMLFVDGHVAAHSVFSGDASRNPEVEY